MLITVTAVTFILTLLTGSSDSHPCDTAPPNTYVCDSARKGYFFYLCLADGRRFEYSCPRGLVFDNARQSCDWDVPGVNDCVQQTPAVPVITANPTDPLPTSASLPSGPCDPATCVLPECRCVGSDIPGQLPLAQVPQMVLLTFDDAIVSTNYYKYTQLFNKTLLSNPNGCGTRATFFVSGDYTDFGLVSRLAQDGHELASHTISHGQPAYWTKDKWDQEIGGMRRLLAQATGRTDSQIAGMRAPYLSLGGEAQYSMLQDRGFLYDSSMYGGSLTEGFTPPLWPFTLKYPVRPSQAVCDQERCPRNSYPGVWEVPLIRQYKMDGTSCAMTDACDLGRTATQEDVMAYLRKNFQRHYTRNRAPFMISLHSYWFDNVPASLLGLQQFLAELSNTPDVWQVTVTQMLDWVRNPTQIDRLQELPSWQC